MSEEKKIFSVSESMFMRFGLKSVSMEDIARELGISKKTLYHFVENKEDLIRKILAERISGVNEKMTYALKNSSDAMSEILNIARYITMELREMSPRVLFDLQKYYRELFQLVESFHNEVIYQLIKDNLERGIKEGLYRREINVEIIARLYVGKNIMLVDETAFPLGTYQQDQLFQEHINYHIRGVASAAGILLLDKYATTK